jgi:acetate kinase
MRVIVVNAGSSSLKLSVLDQGDNVLGSEVLPAPAGVVDRGALREAVDRYSPIDAVGHRVVHGGTEFVRPVLIDDRVVRRLEALSDLAPLHQPKSLRGIEAVSRLLPGAPAVACFDTAFHASIPAAASTYALPAQWRRRWDLRRFGFHGLSHSYASRRAAELMGEAGPGNSDAGPLRVVTCHLGAGASLAAVLGGVSVDTTMGFTPLDGLVMATRSGSVDPGLLVWLEEHVGMPPSELASTLEYRSGLFGLTGSADMREVLASESAGEANAALAISVYLHRLRACIAGMAAALDGLDCLVFTGGVGEHSAPVRWRAAEGLAFLGVALSADANDAAHGDCELTGPGARARCFVVEAREDLEIVRGVRQVLEGR